METHDEFRSRKYAEEALRAWELNPAEITLVSHTENIVFRVDSDSGSRYALRIHRPGYHTYEELKSEPMWTRALNDAGIAAPMPVPTKAGEDYSALKCTTTGEQRYVGLIPWFEGVSLEEKIESAIDADVQLTHYRHLGELMASMHNQAASWSPPSQFQRHAFNLDGLLGEAPFWGRFWDIPELSAEQRVIVISARDWLRNEFSVLKTDPSNYSVIHADLRPANILVHGDKLQIIDFDDAGFGWHMYDIAVALSQAAAGDLFDASAEALVDGYRSIRNLSDDDLSQLPKFILMRILAVLGWLHDRPENDYYQRLPEIIEIACLQAEALVP